MLSPAECVRNSAGGMAQLGEGCSREFVWAELAVF